MNLLARIEDVRTGADGRLLVTASFWVDSAPMASGTVSLSHEIAPSDAVRNAVADACVASAAADFGVDPLAINSSTVL